MTKECFKCKRVLDLTEFYKHPQMKDGHLNKCKECTKKDVSEKYYSEHESRAEYERKRNKTPHRKAQVIKYMRKNREDNPEKYKARSVVSGAIKTNKLVRPNHCSICNELCKPHAHHEDYSRPLDIVWVCVRCHRAITDGIIHV